MQSSYLQSPCSRLSAGLCIFLLTAALAVSQGVTGIISGTITDPTKAPIAGANIIITNIETGVVVWKGTTNESGVYNAPSLPVGTYNVNISATGFKSDQVKNVHLTVDQHADISAALAVGAVSESVTVEGSTAGQLAVDTASLGNTITPSQVQDLPLPSRNVLNLLALTPGVSSGGDITSQGGINSAQLSINGSRTLNSEFLIDGVSVVTGSTGSPQTLPPADSISQFKVLTSSYGAEYGRTSGAIVTMITESGVNQYHGAAYGYFRNEDFDANNYFNNLENKPRPEDRYNLFGGKIGGPLNIPHIYKGTNRTFFFLNYEGLIQASPFRNQSTVPYGPYATGDFSASPTIVDDPLSKTPFPGNIIPANRIDPAARKILRLVPAPNVAGTLNTTDNLLTNNFLSAGSSHPTNNNGLARIDESVSDRLRLFGTFDHFDNFSPIQPTFPGSPLESSVGDSETTGYESTAGLTETWGPTFLSEVRFGFFRNNSEILPPSYGINVPQTLGIGTAYGYAAPELSISGFSMLGSNTNTLRSQIDNNYQFVLTNSKTIGNHLLQFGVQQRWDQFDDFNPPGNVNGDLSFTGELTSPKNTSGDGIDALADFLLGDIKGASYELPQPLIGRRNSNTALYLQDDWKLRPNLTLNLGLRWEYESPLHTANNEYSRVDPTTGEVLFANINASRTLDLTASKLNFAPRVGVAYSPFSKTVIRSGFGIFYAGIFSDVGGQVLFPGYGVAETFPNLGTGIAQPFSLSQGMPSVITNNVQHPQANIAQFTSAANPLTLTDYDGFTQVNHLPYSEEWNFGVQQELTRGIIGELNYVGSHGVHLAINLPTNTVPYDPALDTLVAQENTTLTTQEARPFSTIGSFNSLNMEGVATYNALQAGIRKQAGNNFVFVGNYTWSKAIDDASGLFSFSQPSGLNLGEFPQQFLAINKGLSEFDRTSDVTIAVQYVTKGNRWVRNFEIYPMFSAHTGLPIYIGQSNENAAQTGSNQQRPDLVDPNGSLYVPQHPNGVGVQDLIPVTAANFPLAPTGPYFVGSGKSRTLVIPASLGNLGRNVVRAPGQVDLNISVGRAFHLTERLKFTIRMEAYNALNHTNFSAPSTSLALAATSAGVPYFNSPNFGLITGAGQSRFLQLVARFDF